MKNREAAAKSEKFANSSDLIDQNFTEPFAMFFSKRFAKWHLKPNFISSMSCLAGITGAVLFTFSRWYLDIIGIFVFIFSYVLDCCDGQVARMTHTGSIVGRFFDGVCDSIVYTSLYACLSIRLCDEYIPFTNILWGPWIFLVFALSGFFFHAPQTRIVDYTRNVHMFLISNKQKHEVSSSIDLEKELNDFKGSKFSLNYLRLKSYIPYTKNQEKNLPNCYKLVSIIKDNNLDVSEKAVEILKKHVSVTCVHHTTAYTFNIRTYPIMILILFNLPIIYIPYLIFILQPMKWLYIKRYETAAKEIIDSCYKEYDK